VSAAPEYHPGWPAGPAEDLATLLTAAETAIGGLADGADLGQMADRDAAAVMGTLTTLVGRLDGLRVRVAREVRDRDICGLRGARNLTGWLRADTRLADDEWKLRRVATMTPDLPKIAGLLADGTIGLTQAATACWQISQLPAMPVPPETIEAPEPADAGPVPSTGECDGSGDSSGEDAWAGLWRAGDVHAAADELFATFLPGLDPTQLRQMGAHLREAANAQERAGDDHDDYARRGLRISRSLGGAGEISGRLHAEAAEQVIAAFEELGAKAGPDDKRTKAQRWADVLARLTATSDLPAGPAGPIQAAGVTDPDDDQPCGADAHTGHDHRGKGHDPNSGHDHRGDGRDPDAGHDHGTNEHGETDFSGAGGHDSRGAGGHDANGAGGHDANGAGGHDANGAGGHDANGVGPGGPAATGPSATVPAAYRRPRVIVTVPLSTLLGRPLSPGGALGSGTPLTAEAARRLACDAEIIRLITGPADVPDGGHHASTTARLTELMTAAIAQLPPPLAGPSAVLDIGRKSPGWTPRQRDALYAQYGGHCSAPRCGGPIDVIHHIVHWLYGGKTRIINGAPICFYHHWLVHEGGWWVKKLRDGTIVLIPPPPGWRPGTIYRHGKPVTERIGPPDTS
jgi:hypothetical protein